MLIAQPHVYKSRTLNKMSQLQSIKFQVHPGANPDSLFQDVGSELPLGSGNQLDIVF